LERAWKVHPCAIWRGHGKYTGVQFGEGMESTPVCNLERAWKVHRCAFWRGHGKYTGVQFGEGMESTPVCNYNDFIFPSRTDLQQTIALPKNSRVKLDSRIDKHYENTILKFIKMIVS